jgi:ribonuclease HI
LGNSGQPEEFSPPQSYPLPFHCSEDYQDLYLEEEHLQNQDLELPVSLPSTSMMEIPVGGRLQLFSQQWMEMGASPYIVEVLRGGYKIPFLDLPKMTYSPCMESKSNNPKKDLLLEEQFQDLIQKQVLEEVPGPYYGPSYFSLIFMVPKPNGKWRPIIDLKKLNKHIFCPHFKMETVETIWNSLLPGQFCFSIDLKDAYLHVPIHQSSRKYLRVFRNGRVFQFRALPFGLCTAPLIFTKIVSEVIKMVQRQNMEMLAFLDDWLHQVTTFWMGAQQAVYMKNLCKNLGWIVNLEKSDLTPSQDFVYVGVRWNLKEGRVYPTKDNLGKVKLAIHNFLDSPSQTARTWQSLLGKLTAQQRFLPYARIHTRILQWSLLSQWTQGVDSQEQEVGIPEEVHQEMLWWLNQIQNPEGVPLVLPQFQVHLFTDASTMGWGGIVGDATPYQGLWSQEERKMHINVLELRAVIRVLENLQEPPGTTFLVATDNTTVVAHINKEGGTRSWNLMMETFQLYWMMEENQWSIRARHIPGKFNVLADKLSRMDQNLPTEWSLHQDAANLIFNHWFKPQVDLFATRFNRKCQIFVSPVPDSLALEVDALSMSLEGVEGYAYPPQQVIMRFLQRFQMTRNCKIILVAPFWPKQRWFPILMNLSREPPFQLPHWEKLLRQPFKGQFHQCPEFLDLHAFLLVRNH